jgi:type II secretory pathway pseudopilin PulG
MNSGRMNNRRMNNSTPTRRTNPCPGRSEEGYVLVAVMFMLALLVIAMAVAAPKIAKSIQRDRELETMHRGKQYARAVKLYYKQFSAYPPNVDALVKTNEIRFLRKKYIDPTTGKDEWKVIHLGQNKAPTAFGFFGVPLNGAGMGGGLCGNALPPSTGAGSSSSGGYGSSSGSSFGSSGSGFGSSSGSGFGSSSGSGFGSSSGSGFGSSSGSSSSSPLGGGCPSDSSGSGSGSSTDPNAANANGSNANGGNINGSTDPNAANGGNSTAGGQTGSGSTGSGSGSGSGSTSGTSSTGLGSQTFGGAGIMGFSPNSPKQSILVYKKKTHYNEWEFVYDPIAEQMLMQGGAGGNTGLGTNGLGTNPTGSSGGFGGLGGGGGGNGIGGAGGGFGSPAPVGGGGSGTGGAPGTSPQQQ